MLAIQLFGPVRLAQDGAALPPPALPRTLPLLAYLLLNRDRPIARAALAFTLWPDVPEAEARANLRRHVHALDAALPPAAPDRPWLVRAGATLRWNPAADADLDVATFEDGVRGASASPVVPSPARAQVDDPAPRDRSDLAALAAAVGAYRGDLLPELDDDWVAVERERLRQLYLAALGQLVDRHQAAGELEAATHYAERRVDAEPGHEAAVRQLMALRFVAGDRTGAVRAYHALKRHLAGEVGVAPMPETDALFDRVVGGERLDASPADDGGPAYVPAAWPLPLRSAPMPAAPPVARTNVPAPLTSFVGRGDELDALCRLLGATGGAARLVTLTGPGGAGKTRLAQEAAHRLATGGAAFPDGVVQVSLSAVADPDDVIPTLADALGLPASVDRPQLDDVIDRLRDRRMLIVLDNFEHVVAAAPIVGRLLEAAPGVRMLATSRAVLQVYGEHEVPVPPLALPDLAALPPPDVLGACEAVALFVQRARAAVPSFRLTPDNAPSVADLCVRLDGLPLAIELAAAHVKLFDPVLMTERLAKLPFVAGATPYRHEGRPDRHATLRRAIDWSFALLGPAEQDLFGRLAVFSGSFRIEGVEAVAAGDGAGGIAPPLYALASLVDQSMVLPAERGVDGAPRFRMLRTIREYALERAAAMGSGEEAWRALARYVRDVARSAHDALRGPLPATPFVRLDAEYDDVRAVLLGFVERDAADEGLGLALDLEPYWLARGAIFAARRWVEQLLALGSAAGAPLRADGLRLAGRLARRQGDRPAVLAYGEASLALSEAQGDDVGVARSLLVIASEHSGARKAQIVADSLERFRRAGDEAGIARALQTLGMAAHFERDYATARAYLEQSVAIRRAIGDTWGLDDLLNNLGVVAQGLGELDAARALHAEALDIRQRIGNAPGIAQSRLNLASIDVSSGRTAEACAELRAALPSHVDHGARIGLVECVEWAAGVAAQCGRPAQAIVLYAAAEAGREHLAAVVDPMHADVHNRLRALAEAALAPPRLDEARAQGRALTLEAATDRALAVVSDDAGTVRATG